MWKENLPERNFTARNVLEARRPHRNTCRRRSKRYQSTQRAWEKTIQGNIAIPQLLVFSSRSKFMTLIRKKKNNMWRSIDPQKLVKRYFTIIAQHSLEGEGRGGNFWIHALSGRGTFFICLSWLKNHRPPLVINNEESLRGKQIPFSCTIFGCWIWWRIVASLKLLLQHPRAF